ncbi:MAG: AEC family transporter, partial [Pseudomonadota bacterium]
MSVILSVMVSEILPIFALMALGFCFAKAGKFSESDGSAINRFVFYIGVPALLVLIIAQADLA